MPFATACTVSLHGAVGHLIHVQADVSPGQVGTTLVGRPDIAISEARDRVRMAIINSGLGWPATKRITILLSPADLRKRGTHFDLAMALSVLSADAVIAEKALHGCLFIGELTLDGGLRPVTGVLPMVLAAREAGSAASSCPSHRPPRPRWCPAPPSSACARCARWSPSSRATRCPTPRPWRRPRGPACCPGAAPTATTRSTCPT